MSSQEEKELQLPSKEVEESASKSVSSEVKTPLVDALRSYFEKELKAA